MPSLDNWDAVIKTLRAFTDDINTEDQTATATFRNAHVTINKNGHIDTGMPLHSFTAEADPTEIDITADGDELLITTPTTEYIFRRP